MSEMQALRDPTFRGKYVCDALIWPSISLHILKKLTGKETGDGSRHVYRPSDVRNLKLAQYEIDESESAVQPKRPPVVNCRMAKGGTGKTTVAANLATAFSFMGYKTLMIDADPQASLTNMMGIEASSEDITHIGHLMEESVSNKGHADVSRAVRTVFPGGMLDIIPADITLTNADGWLMNQMQRETVFERLIAANTEFFGQYDVLVVDSAPGTSLLSMNVMVASRTQLAVCWLDRENLKALPILLGNVDEINAAFPNHASDVEIVANGYSAIYKQSKEALEVLVAKYPHQLNENVIQQFSGFHRQQALPGAESKGAVVEQDQNSPGAKAMFDLAKSLLGRYKITLAGFDESIPFHTRQLREIAMAKVSGLMSSGKIGKADQKVVDAMPDAPATAALESSAAVDVAPEAPVLDSSTAPAKAKKSTTLDSSAPKAAVTELAVALVRPSPFQVRSVADSDYIETLMASIVQSGVISPVVVRMLDFCNYEVIAGHHRLEACRRLGHENVPVFVRHMTDSEAACALASDNFVRKELSDYERFKHAKLLKDHAFCKTNSEIGQVLGVSRQLVGFLFAFEDFPAGAKAILEVNPKILGATQANELKDIAREEPDVFTEAIALLAEDKIRQNQIRLWIESKFKSSSVRMQRRQEIKISRPGLRSPIKLTYTDREAKIQAEGLNVSRLKKLIEDNLDSLISQ